MLIDRILTKLVRSRWLDIGHVLFFLRVLWTKMQSRSKNSQKKRTRLISSQLDRTSLVNKGFIYIWLLGKFFSRDKAGSPERARELHILLTRVANHSAEFDSFCPLAELAIQ